MNPSLPRRALMLALAATLAGCAGVRGGWVSEPQLPPQPALGLEITPLNQMTDHAFRPVPWVFHVGDDRPKRLRFSVVVTLSPAMTGWRFDPLAATAIIDGRPVALADAHLPDQPQAYLLQAMPIAPAPVRTQVLLNFNVAAPDPSKAWALDLGQALVDPAGKPMSLPVVRFEPVRWRAGY